MNINNLNELINDNIDISKYGYKKLASMYLEFRGMTERNYIFQNLVKVNNVNIDDIFEVITYCSLYNRSYQQIKSSDDTKLQRSDYLNTLNILIDTFKDIVARFDKKNEYILEEYNELDYLDLIVVYLKEIKDFDILYTKLYELFELVVWNDLKVFYKLVYVLLTNDSFNSLKCRAIYEVYYLKDILFNYLERSNNIDGLKDQINKLFISVPTISKSDNLNKIIELIELRSVCCDRSVTFFDDGYKMFNFFNSNKLFDYSSVSLQFFKVIEIELKEKVILYCGGDLDEEQLYKGITESEDLSKFKTDFLERLELGKIRYILRNVKSLMYDIRNEQEVKYYNEEVAVFYKKLIALFINVDNINFFLGILHNNCVNLYRNSAVHTGILSYERANEAIIITKLFLKQIKLLNYSFSVSNALNVEAVILPSFVKELMNE